MSDSIKIVVGVILIALAILLCTQCHHDATPSSAAAPTAGAAAAPVSAALGFARDGGKVMLTGRVPDAVSRERLTTAARARFGLENVRDQLTIDAAADKCAWLASDAWLDAVDNGGVAEASLDCSVLVLEGTVDTEAAREQIASTAAARLGASVRIDNRIKLRDTVAQQQIAAVLQLKNIEFESARAVLTPTGIAAGHTDSRGNPAANQALSLQRAQAVRDYLVSKGLSADRFTTMGYGAEKPIADNATAAGRRQNRRIEFVQVGG
jgi:OmpA-OmpF porin, OOP family